MSAPASSSWAAPPRRWRARDPFSGYSHLTGLALGFVGAVLLLVLRRDHGTASMLTALVYGVCLVNLYASSSVYHLLPSEGAMRARLRKLDHAAIFLMIAGTCTPIFWRAFDGGARAVMLSGIWVLAAAGIVFRFVWLSAPRLLYTLVYLAMGWMFVVQGPRGFHALPGLALSLVLVGGLTYTLGAVVYALKRPNPFPPVFGFHEIWHLFVLAGSAFHYAAIATLA
jgi:hemolysin III